MTAGSLGPATVGPLAVTEDEEYVGAPVPLLVPLLAMAAALLLSSALLWERRKDRKVAAARRSLSARLSQLRERAS